MSNRAHDTLQDELLRAGASSSEVNELTSLAASLKELNETSEAAKKHVPFWRRLRAWKIIPIGVTALTGVAVGMALVIVSQTVLPGNVLYPVQKFSDNIAVSLDPNYRGTVMMRRAQQVRQLVAGHAGSGTVLAALADYRAQAAAYTSASTNYAVFEYCKNNLQQAAAIAPSPERQAINDTLASLKNV